MKYIPAIPLIFLLLSCDSSRVYEDFNELEEVFWHMDSTQIFTFQINDTSKFYNLYATFRNSSRYPYYNIYFKYTLKDSTDTSLAEELVEYHFFDPKTGKPLGNGLGDLFDHLVQLEDDLKFGSTGEYQIALQQFMRLDTLPFLMSVGARVEFAK